MADRITLQVTRYRPERETEPTQQSYEVPLRKDWAVLDSRGNPVIVDGKPLVVSWESAQDMDAFALHTEAHIRSGDRMAELGLRGAEGVRR